MPLVAVLTSILMVHTAFAQQPSPTETRWPLMARAEMSLVDGHNGFPEPEWSLTVGYNLTTRLLAEGTLGASAQSTPWKPWMAMANLRWSMARSADGGHALTLAGGPLALFNNYIHGNNGFVHGEVGYLLRSPLHMTFLLAVGMNVSLSESNRSTAGVGFLSGSRELHRGDVMAHLRAGVGWSW